MAEEGHLTGDRLKIKNHPGNPREFFGPLKTEPEELFIHTTEDLKNLDLFLEFVIGNGQMICRMDALCSQHLMGRNTRGVMGVNDSDAWGAEGFPFYRCRPAGRLVNNLFVTSEKTPLGPEHLSNYLQKVNLESGVLETSFDWELGDSCGHTDIAVFFPQVDPHVMVFRFCDRIDAGVAVRSATVETLVPYHHRPVKSFTEDGFVTPTDNARYSVDDKSAHYVEYEFFSDVMHTKYVWYAKALPASEYQADIEQRYHGHGEMEYIWECPQGEQIHTDIVYAIVSDRSADNPYDRAANIIAAISSVGVDQYQTQHNRRWKEIWSESSLCLPDKFWQKEFEIARYNLLINAGGNWIGNIAMDEFAWDAHMLDSNICLNALVEWGHLDKVLKAYQSISRLYSGAVENAELVSHYLDKKVEGEAALLPTFLTYDGRVALYAINHFMLHSEQNSVHSLGILKLTEYLGDAEMGSGMLYCWLRAYANYALLISDWDDERNGYVFPLWRAGTLQEGEWWHHQIKELPLERLETIADLFPESLQKLKIQCPADTTFSHKWVLLKASEAAESLGRDPELVAEWRNVAEKICIPQNDEIILRHEYDDGKTRGHIPPELWGLFYPCEGMHKTFPPNIISATLKASYARRNPHVPSWNGLFYAVAFAMVGDGETAWEMLQLYLSAQDPRCIQAQDNVDTEGFVYYYELNYGLLLLALRNMLLRYHDDEVVLFPAVPEAWNGGVQFERLPIGGGMRVSAKLNGENGEAVITGSNGECKLRLTGKIKGFSIMKSQLLDASGETIEV